MAARTRTYAVVGLALVTAVTAGCAGTGSGSGSGSTASPAGSSSGGAGGGQNNAAPTESNPPGDIPDNQAFVAYRPTGGSFTGFTVKVPEGWARTDQGSTTVFTDKLNTVKITAVSAAGAPTTRSVNDTVIPQLRSQVPKFAAPKVLEVTRHSGRVVLLTYRGDSTKDPVTGKVVRDAFERYAFYRAGHEVDLTLSGPVKADNVDPWRIVSDSFTWR
ncbi:hypothetical protein [Streptomyces stelliscabiei]|uniref:hypothetical protein n=1 Tax=Streptomyces stelliscabiei TaxID=146820 RepID=UPI0029A3B66A|nr:hypothetical protein [Streptomyces stelliscabiei]MDX2661074.1 hypothetical protein [Streptomyces stelliscabiei]MDX2715941.1 hypothetical protein [Streptomyces stelliscabiei]MDX2790051.1 hypothetical protein [Streptomyces stelliscabiei]